MNTVLIIANEWTTIVHFRMEILQGLIASGFRVVVALPECEEAKPIREAGCELVNLNIARHGKNPLDDLKTFKQCKDIIRTYNPDIAITYTVKPNIYGGYACRRLHIPYINNITGVGAVLQSNSPIAKLMLIMMRIAFKKSDCVLFQNYGNYNRLIKENVITKNTRVVFLPGSGVNIDKFSYIKYPDDETIKFVIVSRIRRDKGYTEFFDAAEQIKEKYPDSEFHVIGWSEDDDLCQRISDLVARDVIVNHGSLSQEEVHNVVASCSCLVHPSYHEGMANVLLEAAATGRPVIASNICGCKEAVEDGITGFLCEVRNSDSLKEAMERFISCSKSKRESMGLAGRKKIEKEFDRRLVVDKLISEINHVLNKTEEE